MKASAKNSFYPVYPAQYSTCRYTPADELKIKNEQKKVDTNRNYIPKNSKWNNLRDHKK